MTGFDTTMPQDDPGAKGARRQRAASQYAAAPGEGGMRKPPMVQNMDPRMMGGSPAQPPTGAKGGQSPGVTGARPRKPFRPIPMKMNRGY